MLGVNKSTLICSCIHLVIFYSLSLQNKQCWESKKEEQTDQYQPISPILKFIYCLSLQKIFAVIWLNGFVLSTVPEFIKKWKSHCVRQWTKILCPPERIIYNLKKEHINHKNQKTSTHGLTSSSYRNQTGIKPVGIKRPEKRICGIKRTGRNSWPIFGSVTEQPRRTATAVAAIANE